MLFLLMPVINHEVPRQISQWFDGVVLPTVAVQAYDIVWPCHRTDSVDDLLYDILLVVCDL